MTAPTTAPPLDRNTPSLEATAGLRRLATYPFALYYSAAYTDSLFLLTIVAACYHVERDELWTAGLWGLVPTCAITSSMEWKALSNTAQACSWVNWGLGSWMRA